MTACGPQYVDYAVEVNTVGELVIKNLSIPDLFGYPLDKGVEARTSVEDGILIATGEAYNNEGGPLLRQNPTYPLIIGSGPVVLKVFIQKSGTEKDEYYTPFVSYRGNDKKVKFNVRGYYSNKTGYWNHNRNIGVVYANFTNGKGDGIFGQEASTDGRLTITGLEAYEGRKIYARGTIYDGYGNYIADIIALDMHFGYDNAHGYVGYEEFFFGRVSSGQVVLKVYSRSWDSVAYDYNYNYNGDHQNVELYVHMESMEDDGQYYDFYGSVIVDFTDGIAGGVFVPRVRE